MRTTTGLFGKSGLFKVPNDWLKNIMIFHKELSKEKERKREAYIQHVTTVLTMCQFIEISLKYYLETALTAQQFILKGKLPYNQNIKVMDLSMGKALELYKIYNDNKTLQKKIDKLIKDRNHYAHKGYILFAGKQKQILEEIEWLDENIDKCNELFPKLQNILTELQNEHNALIKEQQNLCHEKMKIKPKKKK